MGGRDKSPGFESLVAHRLEFEGALAGGAIVLERGEFATNARISSQTSAPPPTSTIATNSGITIHSIRRRVIAASFDKVLQHFTISSHRSQVASRRRLRLATCDLRRTVKQNWAETNLV